MHKRGWRGMYMKDLALGGVIFGYLVEDFEYH